MKLIYLSTLVVVLLQCQIAKAQKDNLTAAENPENWSVYNREVSFNNKVIHLDAQQGDGLLWLKSSSFTNGNIELDIKGKNAPGQSFVGIAFHGQDNSTFDGIYFRPFNFKNPERNSHSVQYIAMPDNDWSALRNAYPGKYENSVQPVPNPDDWFHATIEIQYPIVKVYVNGSSTPTLEIKQISNRQTGKVGLWVGNGSEGWFKNIQFNSNAN